MDELTRLVEKNFYVITHLFEFAALKSEIVPKDPAKARIVSDKFHSLTEIKNYLLQIYISSEVNRLLYNYFDGRPLYFEENGCLMAWVDQIPGAGYYGRIDQYQISIQAQSNDTITALVKIPIFNEEDEPKEEKKYIINAKYENGWKLAELFG